MQRNTYFAEYRKIAYSLGLEVLSESHNEYELDRCLEAGCEIIGINNRDLKTFEVSLDTVKRLSAYIPEGHIKVSESGIRNNEDMRRVYEYGADAVLIGETLMRSSGIAESMKELLQGCR